MTFSTEMDLVNELEKFLNPIQVELTISILDKRLAPVKATAKIIFKTDETKKTLAVILDILESEHIFADENGSIYGSFGIDESIEVYEETLVTISYNNLIGNKNWKAECSSLVTEENLKGYLHRVLKDYQFTDLSGKYRFRKNCEITALNRIS